MIRRSLRGSRQVHRSDVFIGKWRPKFQLDIVLNDWSTERMEETSLLVADQI